MLRTCAAAAKVDGRVSAFLEPIALYMTKDLHEPRDGLWSFPYQPPGFSVPIGRARTWTEGEDLTILSYANGLWMSLRVAKRLEQQHGIRCRVVDLRWLNPLPIDDMVEAAEATGTVLVVDEGRRTGGVAEGVMAALAERIPGIRLAASLEPTHSFPRSRRESRSRAGTRHRSGALRILGRSPETP